MSIRFLLIAGFSILIIIFTISYFVNQRLSNAVVVNTAYFNNSEVIIRNSNRLHMEMIQMQSGFRGFLLTNQETFLQSYYNGIKNVPPLLNEQQYLISSMRQRERLDSIVGLHHEWAEYADSLISTKRDTLAAKKYEQLFNSKLKTEVGKKLNDKIQAIFLAFDSYEYRVREESRKALQGSIRNTRTITLLLTIISIFIAIVSSVYIIQLITKRISKMVTLAHEISKGNFRTMEEPNRDELNELSVSLNTMSLTLEKNFKELKKKNTELDQFAYVVSHDLKAPLRGITNLIEWIEEDHSNEMSPEVAHNLSRIKGRTTRLENMINGLLKYAKIGRTKTTVEKVDTKTLVEEIAELIVPKNFEVIIDPELPGIETEKLYIEQVFSNLISNAVKYNRGENGKIIISSSETTTHYIFSVEDNGIGIDKEYFEKIFIIFQTLQERDAFESDGVGLAIVKKIVEDHKGGIKVESTFGKGSKFVFTWSKV